MTEKKNPTSRIKWTKKRLIAELEKGLRENRSLREQRNRCASELGKAKRTHEDWLLEMEPMYQFMVTVAKHLSIKVRNPIEMSEKIPAIRAAFGEHWDRSSRLKGADKRADEADRRAEKAEFQCNVEREFCKDAERRLVNERERSRSLQFLVNSQPTIADYDRMVHEVHTLKCIIANVFKASIAPGIVACPRCGKTALIPDGSVSQQPGYRLCPECLGDLPDPWAENEKAATDGGKQ